MEKHVLCEQTKDLKNTKSHFRLRLRETLPEGKVSDNVLIKTDLL